MHWLGRLLGTVMSLATISGLAARRTEINGRRFHGSDTFPLADEITLEAALLTVVQASTEQDPVCNNGIRR